MGELETQSEIQSWTPDSGEWLWCKLVKIAPTRRHLIGELSTGDLVWIRESTISFAPNGHSYCLPIGRDGSVTASVRIERCDEGHFYPFRAIECQISDEGIELPPLPPREPAIVEHWKNNCGSVRRACGCSLFCKIGNKPDDGYFRPGESVDIYLEFNTHRQQFIGKVIQQLISDS